MDTSTSSAAPEDFYRTYQLPDPEELEALLNSQSGRATADVSTRSSLPNHYEPYANRVRALTQWIDHYQTHSPIAVPWHRKFAKFIGNSTYLKNISPLFGYFWLSWKTAHGACMLILDLALIIYTLMLILRRQMMGMHEVSMMQIAVFIGIPLYIQTPLPIATWIFGYIGPRESTYTAHAVVAGIRAACSLGCFVFVYFRTDFGLLYPHAIRLVSWLALSSLAHLTGACMRTAHFQRERAQALRNPSDRRIHQGNGFMTSYLSLEDQEKQKAAARARVGVHDSYVQTMGEYWHCPPSELDVQHDVYGGAADDNWWHKLWKFRTPLQRHVKRVADMREWPLNFEQSAPLHNDLFARCDCCTDSDELPEPLLQRPEGLEEMQHRRVLFTSGAISHHQRPNPVNGEWPTEEVLPTMVPDAPSVPLHQLCERCESMCCESEMLSLLAGSSGSRFWRHIQATFTFTHRGPLLEETFFLWESALALRASASMGCHICSMLWSSLSPWQQAALVREVNAYANTDYPKDLGVFVKILSPHGWQPDRDSSTDPSSNLFLVTHFGPRRVARFWMEQKFALRARSLGIDPLLEHPELLPPVRICLTDPADLAAFSPPSGSPSTGSSAAMNFVKYWLSAHQHHAETRTSPLYVPQPVADHAALRVPTRPKRLLEIAEDQRVRLVCDMPHAHGIPYVALSYCWHSTQNCILKADTLSRYMDGVAMHVFPPTIQDALQVTQKLGFRYIWIDALCIIQDSDDDKVQQLKHMHSIYAGAAFVIAAAAAMDSSQRFLVDQMPHAMSACFLDLEWNPSVTQEGRLELHSGGNALVALPCQKFASAPQYELSLSRLKSRGWVCQEEELAARVLYFCDRQLILRCNLCRKTAVQQYLPPSRIRNVPNTIWVAPPIISMVTSPFRAVRDWLNRNSNYQKDQMAQVITCLSGVLSPMTGHRLSTERTALPSTQHERWWTLVSEYSTRHLSYGADKLPAIQGLAERFQSELLAAQNFETHPEPVRYVSGLWSGEAFVTGLLWYVKDGTTVRPAQRAPSWSWAAVDGVIGHNSVNGHPHVDACGVSVLQIPESQDEKLILSATLKPATWHRAPENRRMYYIGHRRHGTVRFQHDLAQYEPLTIDLSQGPEAHILRDLSGRDVGYLIFDTENDLPIEGSEIYCLGITVKPATRREERDFNVPWATRGLALVKDDEDPGAFRRLGYIELQRTPGGISYRSSMNPARQKAERNPPPNVDVAGFFDGCEASTVALV